MVLGRIRGWLNKKSDTFMDFLMTRNGHNFMIVLGILALVVNTGFAASYFLDATGDGSAWNWVGFTVHIALAGLMVWTTLNEWGRRDDLEEYHELREKIEERRSFMKELNRITEEEGELAALRYVKKTDDEEGSIVDLSPESRAQLEQRIEILDTSDDAEPNLIEWTRGEIKNAT